MDKQRVYKWKQRGLVETDENIIKILERYHNTTNCDKCDVLLTNINCSSQKCMDHNHKTGKFRNIICKACNLHTDRKKQTYTRMSEEERKHRQKISWNKTDEKRKNNPERIIYKSQSGKLYREKNREKLKQNNKKYHEYKNSWGGDKRRNNNLLQIDPNLFC
tara:strand:+ start:456 stop:941 length:486 start_codon:yes stop_codon:yes gene_type:complete